jgi:hypothetical protein
MTKEKRSKDCRPADNKRCSFTTPRGRRCAEFRSARHDSLCAYHARREQEADPSTTPEARAIVSEVLGTRENFQTATQVNQALGKIFALRARKLISIRDAALLGYLSQLLLNSLHSVHTEFENVYSSRAWESIIEDALRHPGLNLPPLEEEGVASPVSGIRLTPEKSRHRTLPKGKRARVASTSLAVGAASLPKGKGAGVASSSLAVGAASPVSGVRLTPEESRHRTLPKGKGAGAASSSPSSVRSHEKKPKPRPLPETGAEFAQQVFEQVAADRARRKKRTAEDFPGQQEEDQQPGAQQDELPPEEQQMDEQHEEQQQDGQEQEEPGDYADRTL